MALIDQIIERRRRDARYDGELWDFVERMEKRPLEHMADLTLQIRLDQIERNIQYLDVGPSGRDELPPERGWLSPWWWLRLRHWTFTEMSRRSLTPQPTNVLKPMPTLHPEFQGVVAGGGRLLVRISRAQYLMETIEGRLRFAPAHTYKAMEGDEARADDELSKAYRRPGREIRITGPNGHKIEALGDVTFSTTRMIGNELKAVPYWLCSYSSDLDPRLINEFSSGYDDEAVLVIFDPNASSGAPSRS